MKKIKVKLMEKLYVNADVKLTNDLYYAMKNLKNILI